MNGETLLKISLVLLALGLLTASAELSGRAFGGKCADMDSTNVVSMTTTAANLTLVPGKHYEFRAHLGGVYLLCAETNPAGTIVAGTTFNVRIDDGQTYTFRTRHALCAHDADADDVSAGGYFTWKRTDEECQQ